MIIAKGRRTTALDLRAYRAVSHPAVAEQNAASRRACLEIEVREVRMLEKHIFGLQKRSDF